jgi:FkbM family methyltransferase
MYDISQYRSEVLKVLNETGNHYDTKIIDLKRLQRDIQYHRWMHPYQGDWELTEVFTDEILINLSKIIKRNSTVIDIGAQSGNMSVAYSLFADKVLSFEPNPATFEVLEKNATINKNIIPFNYAITDEPGPLTFHYSDNGFCNGGFASRTNKGIGVTGHVIPIDVWGINLVNFLNEENIIINDLSMVKIDAEGHDKDIIRTIEPLLKKNKPVLITEIYSGFDNSEVQDLIDVIHSVGYKAYDENNNKLDIENLGKEIKSYKDINILSGHNLICIYDT